MKKTLLLVAGVLFATILLSGCGQLNAYTDKEIQSQADSSIHEMEEYQRYQQYASDELLDENGTYKLVLPEASESAAPIDSALIPVSFARNTYLSCLYHRNSNEDYPLGTEVCYLAPGDSLYASGTMVNNSLSNLYNFSEFRIWSYDSEGRRGEKPYAEIKNKNGLLLTIPTDYVGSGFSVEPIGIYSNRKISVSAGYIDNANEQKNLDGGIWSVGNQEFKNEVSISPVVSYTIKYDFSHYENDYYFVSSSPECWYSKENDCTVIFKEATSHEENTQYSVLMHPYVTLTIKNRCISALDTVKDYIPFIADEDKGMITSIKKDDADILPENHDVDCFFLEKLRVGEKITIRVGKEYKISGKGVNVGRAVPLGSNADNGYEYSFIVPDTNKGIEIEVTERNSEADGTYQGYSIENADLTLIRANGTVVNIGDELPADGETITVEIAPHTGYYLNGKNVEDYVKYRKKMKYSDFQKKADAIIKEHPAVHFVSITICYSDECGTCVYKLDGKSITEKTVEVRIGQKIELEFTVNNQNKIIWDGWVASKWSSLWGTNKISDKIEVTADMNGTTINRSSFDIKIEEVG